MTRLPELPNVGLLVNEWIVCWPGEDRDPFLAAFLVAFVLDCVRDLAPPIPDVPLEDASMERSAGVSQIHDSSGNPLWGAEV